MLVCSEVGSRPETASLPRLSHGPDKVVVEKSSSVTVRPCPAPAAADLSVLLTSRAGAVNTSLVAEVRPRWTRQLIIQAGAEQAVQGKNYAGPKQVRVRTGVAQHFWTSQNLFNYSGFC